MIKNIANRSFSILIATLISISLFSGCGIANDEISAEQSENVSVSIITDEIPVTITTETTVNFLEDIIVETTESKTETAESATESEQVTTTEEQTTTTTETTTVTTAEEKTTYKSPKYIDNYKFTDEDKKQLERECLIITANSIYDDDYFTEGKATEEQMNNYVFSTFGNGEGIWGLDYIETFDLSKQADPLGKFRDTGLCDVFDAEGVDKFLMDVFSYEATHEENYKYVYYYEGKYYKYTGDGGGYEIFNLTDLSPIEDGKYLAKFDYTDYENNYTTVYAVFKVFDDNGRTRYHYCLVTNTEPDVKTNNKPSGNKWYQEVLDQYDTVFAIPECGEYVYENPGKYKYVSSMAAQSYQYRDVKPEMYLYDIDSNGTEELICQYNIYLYDGDKIHMLFDPDGEHLSLGDRSSMEIYKNGIIGVHWAGGAFTFANEYFKINGTNLYSTETINYDEYEDEENPVWKEDNPQKHYPAEMFSEFISVYGEAIDLAPYMIS